MKTKLRKGRTYRVYDFKRFTIALDPESRGGVFSPEIRIYDRAPKGLRLPYRKGSRSIRIKVPYITWAFAHAYKHFGVLKLHVWWHLFIHRLFDSPEVRNRFKEARKASRKGSLK